MTEKNTLLTEMDKEISHFRKSEETMQISNTNKNNLYNKRILTNSDWFAFKASFEDSYPGYIRKLNKHHGYLSEAEQRILLFIKLGFTSKDISSVLGISVDSVKKRDIDLKSVWIWMKMNLLMIMLKIFISLFYTKTIFNVQNKEKLEIFDY